MNSASTILLVEQSAAVALEIADYGYVMENGRIVLDGDRERLRGHQRRAGILSRPGRAASAEAIATSSNIAGPEVVWLSLRSSI